MSFPRFGPNGAFAFFSDERDVPAGWQPTAEDARRMQTLAPPPFAEMPEEPPAPPAFGRVRKGRRK